MSEHYKTVAVQGLGFAGAAMSAAVLAARDLEGRGLYRIIGVDLADKEGKRRIEALDSGRFPFETVDPRLEEVIAKAHEEGRVSAASSEAAFAQADIVLVDVNLDIRTSDPSQPDVDISGFERAIQTLGRNIRPQTLVIIETTVPPGTCEKLVVPILTEEMFKRGELKPDDTVLLAHSFERVMPGADYLDSIVNYWRVYSGHTEKAANLCKHFLENIINTKEYPLTRLPDTTSSEIAKVLENSYRAVNIAFMDEWGRFAERLDIDLFKIIDAIRLRPTHNNIRQPGFGVGGYCLTKDPLFAQISARKFYELKDIDFPFCRQAVENNRSMPLASLDLLRSTLGTGLREKRILLCGVSYRQDVGDTRHSPSEDFVRQAEEEGAIVTCHDPMIAYWEEMERTLEPELPSPDGFDAVVFAVPHREYRGLSMKNWFRGKTAVVLDANRVLNSGQLRELVDSGATVRSIGRGGAI